MEKQDSNFFNFFLRIGHIEGVSYLVLLFIAMPLKYWAGIPMAVKVVGYLHGLLFVAYCIALLIVFLKLKWPFLKGFYAFLLSLIPFGTFWLYKFKN
jgi:integral membrane protein